MRLHPLTLHYKRTVVRMTVLAVYRLLEVPIVRRRITVRNVCHLGPAGAY